jgi:hypothetical protein
MADDFAERLERLENALFSVDAAGPEARALDALRSRLDEIDARLAHLEDAVYPVDPASGWGQNRSRESGRPSVNGMAGSTLHNRS